MSGNDEAHGTKDPSERAADPRRDDPGGVGEPAQSDGEGEVRRTAYSSPLSWRRLIILNLLVWVVLAAAVGFWQSWTGRPEALHLIGILVAGGFFLATLIVHFTPQIARPFDESSRARGTDTGDEPGADD